LRLKREETQVRLGISNGHSPQIRETRSLLVRMCQGESHFSQKWPLANVGESGESLQHNLANVGESGEYLPSLLMNVGSSKIGSLHLLNLPNSPNLLNSRKTHQTCLSRVWRVRATWLGESGESVQHGLANVGESGESDTFSKKAILASTRIR
jgi:hypothetical protein